MHKAISAVVLSVAVVAAVPSVKHAAAPAAHRTPAPAKLATPPPEISHVVSRPFCSALRTNIGPAIGTILQNDNIIRQGPPLFSDYNRFNGNGDMSQGSKQLTVVKMENMVTPLVGNIASVEEALRSQGVFHVPPRTADEKRLLEMREQLLEVLAMQKASLDIINGFVTTQQLGDMQHEGMGVVGSINGDVDDKKMTGRATPDPLLHDPNAAGLPEDSHFIDPATIPGLTLGYNPVVRLNDGLKWTQAQAHAREDVAAKHVMEAVHLCNPAPAPSPTPAH